MFDRSEIDALIEYAADQLEQVGAIYANTLEEKKVSRALQVRIKNVVENQRSALEYLAHAIYQRYGDGKGTRSYYPIALNDKTFPAVFDRCLPGVAKNRPDVRDAIEAAQPYQPDFEWLHHLSLLTNENKHRRLTPQTRTEQLRVRVDASGGGSVEWAPVGVRFSGPGVFIGGVPVDPRTQRPVPSPTQTMTETIYVDWLFSDPQQSALATLRRIQDGLSSLIDDVIAALPKRARTR